MGKQAARVLSGVPCQFVSIYFKELALFSTKFVALAHGVAAKVNSALPLVGLGRVKQ